MAGPLAVKLGSTGWRFVRYYAGSPAHVREGSPPQDLDEHMPRQPGGGRRSRLERAARKWAAEYLPDLELTAAEPELVEEFLRDDPRGSPSDLRGNRRPAGCTLPRATWLGLRDLVQRQRDEPRRWRAEREEERRRVALAEHPGGEYLGGGLVLLSDGHVARSSATASNAELRSAIGVANDAAVKALLAQGRSLASLVGDEPTAARPLFERALAISERMLGPQHPDTARNLDGLALLLRDQGDPAAARPRFERALAIRERVLGPDHPDTVATRRALAELAEEGDGAAA